MAFASCWRATAGYAPARKPHAPLRSLFHGDMREQGRQLMVILHMVVPAGLSRLEELVPSVQQLGVRHPGGLGKQGRNLVLQL